MIPETPPPQTAVPTCYRHPGRETHVRCSRCDRPICPDCMISASVGFQCPECVNAGNARTRTARTPFGGRVSDDPGYASKAIIALCVLGYLAPLLLGRGLERRLYLIGLVRDFGTLAPAGVGAGEWYRLLTGAFLHGGIFHLLLNMYALYLFGPPLEAALGRLRFVALYLLAALGAAATSYGFNAPNQPTLGASGAIFGLFAAFFVVSRRLGRDVSQLWVLLLINAVLGFVLPNIDWRAHVGGFLTGGAVALVLVYAPRRRRTFVQVAGCLAVLALVLVAVTSRTAQLTGAGGVEVAACAVRAPLQADVDYLGCISGSG